MKVVVGAQPSSGIAILFSQVISNFEEDFSLFFSVTVYAPEDGGEKKYEAHEPQGSRASCDDV